MSLLCSLFLRRTDFANNAEMNTNMPPICWNVQALSKSTKERKSVAALRAVDVMLIVNAPKFLVMAALQEEPKKPIELKS
jgi:hypothetical protein